MSKTNEQIAKQKRRIAEAVHASSRGIGNDRERRERRGQLVENLTGLVAVHYEDSGYTEVLGLMDRAEAAEEVRDLLESGQYDGEHGPLYVYANADYGHDSETVSAVVGEEDEPDCDMLVEDPALR